MQPVGSFARIASVSQLYRPLPRLLSRRIPFVIHHASHISTRRFAVQTKKETRPDLDSINIYEQETKGGKLIRVDPDEEDKEDEFEKDVADDLEILDHELHTMAKPEEEMEEAVDALGAQMTDEQIEEGIEAITSRGLRLQDVLPHHVSTTEPLPRQSEIYLDKLNEALNEASIDLENDKVRTELWKWYQRSKTNIPGLKKFMPKGAWDLLWKSQNDMSLKNFERGPHLCSLAEDKLSAGWALTKQERVSYIEGLFLKGEQNKAFKLWDEVYSEVEGIKDDDFLQLGIRMCARAGKPTKASEILIELFETHPNADPRVIRPLIEAYTKEKSDKSLAMSWTLYLEMKQRLRSNMDVEDFDAVTQVYLGAGMKSYALAVFRDMMLCGPSTAEGVRPQSRQDLGQIMNFVSDSETAEEATSISLAAISYLPRRFQNKFFYASWLKKLIGEGRNDEASQVVELMWERGVHPDAKHMNGLVSGWLRASNIQDIEKAEQLGWSMIQERINFVLDRTTNNTGQQQGTPVSVQENNEGARIPKFVLRPVPFATIETFCILVRHYLKRSMYNHARHLRNLLDPAELKMNSFFMNSLLQAELHTRGYRRTWIRFEIMSQQVKPDMDTWTCLWECMKKHVDSTQDLASPGFPTPRELFRQFMRWLTTLRGQQLHTNLEEFETDTYHDIIHIFCASKDLAGCFAAIHQLHQVFGAGTQRDTTRLLLTRVSRLIMPTAHSLRSRRSKLKTPFQEHDAQLRDFFKTIWKQRMEQMDTNGFTYQDLDDQEKAEENHRARLSLILAIMQRRGEHFDLIEEAAKDMGIETFDVENAITLTR